MRLACVTHAASVCPEPGSNSPSKFVRHLPNRQVLLVSFVLAISGSKLHERLAPLLEARSSAAMYIAASVAIFAAASHSSVVKVLFHPRSLVCGASPASPMFPAHPLSISRGSRLVKGVCVGSAAPRSCPRRFAAWCKRSEERIVAVTLHQTPQGAHPSHMTDLLGNPVRSFSDRSWPILADPGRSWRTTLANDLGERPWRTTLANDLGDHRCRRRAP